MSTVFNTWFPSAKTGRQVYNVMGYGATGNGVTDDTNAIQTAINAAIDGGGGTVYFPTGLYLVSAALVFNHNGVYTGNKLIRLAGEKSIDDGTVGTSFGALLSGNVSGYIFDYNQNETYTLTGSAGTFTVGDTLTKNPTDGRATFPILSTSGSHPNLVVVVQGGGDRFSAGTAIKDSLASGTGTVGSVAYNQNVLYCIDHLGINNSNNTSGNGCIRLENMTGGQIENCYMKGYIGLFAVVNIYALHVTACTFTGNGNVSGSIGVMMKGGVNVHSCQLLGWDTAIRHYSLGGSIVGCRFEVNNLCVQTGKDENNVNNTSTALLIASCQSEQCNTSVNLFSGGGFAVIANAFTGAVNVAGSSERDYGIRLFSDVKGTLIAGNNISGNMKVAGIAVDSSDITNGLDITIMGNYVNNTSVAGGTNWIVTGITTVPSNNIYAINNNTPSLAKTFANLPSTAVVSDGQRDFCSNSSVTTFGAVPGGTGTSHVPVYWDATSTQWKVG